MGLGKMIQKKNENSYKKLQEAKNLFSLGPLRATVLPKFRLFKLANMENAFILLVSKFVEFDKVAPGKNVP